MAALIEAGFEPSLHDAARLILGRWSPAPMISDLAAKGLTDAERAELKAALFDWLVPKVPPRSLRSIQLQLAGSAKGVAARQAAARARGAEVVALEEDLANRGVPQRDRARAIEQALDLKGRGFSAKHIRTIRRGQKGRT